MKIKYIDYGLAYTVETKQEKYIELNKALLKEPKLLKKVFEHELGHINRQKLIDHIIYDFKEMFNPIYLSLVWFQIKNPSTLVSNLPIYRDEKTGEITYNVTAFMGLILFVVSVIIIFLGYYYVLSWR